MTKDGQRLGRRQVVQQCWSWRIFGQPMHEHGRTLSVSYRAFTRSNKRPANFLQMYSKYTF